MGCFRSVFDARLLVVSLLTVQSVILLHSSLATMDPSQGSPDAPLSIPSEQAEAQPSSPLSSVRASANPSKPAGPSSSSSPSFGPAVGGSDHQPPGVPDLTDTRGPRHNWNQEQEGGGMHVGPRHPFFTGGDPRLPGGYPTPPLPPGFVPGARYDPIGPYGAEPNPDHLRPPRWDNRGDMDPAGDLGGNPGFGGLGGGSSFGRGGFGGGGGFGSGGGFGGGGGRII
ncbi:pi31 proteasome regulator [Cystoisospora suis]|uniref:Pi31 proteasome regulator n=1 Tax=Cystoisospora suis TaxID=483139 RepID=A0A2C6L313_9APIC|nr:pi31 proteasome regulator [Cystoisospora suis]